MTDRFPRSLSLIIPVYREGSEVYQVLAGLFAYLQHHFDDFEIIVALDGQDSETCVAVDKFATKSENVRVNQSSKRRGKGGAILDAFSVARCSLVAISDADTSAHPSQIGKLVQSLLLHKADAAIGSRYIKGSRRTVPITRLILSRFFNVIVRGFTGLNINDTQCGLKVVSSKFIPSLVNYLNESGWAFDVQMLFIMKSLGAKIVEVPIDWIYAEGSRMQLSKDVPRMFLSVARARYLNQPNN